MSKSENEYYYEVALSLPATWKQNCYTYHSEDTLQIGEIIFAPFGSAQKIGYVLRETSKPVYKTKSVLRTTGLILPEKTTSFIAWLMSYYPGVPGAHVQHFIPSTLGSNAKRTLHTQKTNKSIPHPHLLTADQVKAYSELTENSIQASILHGITGSGKTRLYCELIQKNLREGKDTLVLYPEISLSTQIEETMIDFFGPDLITTYHSKRTPAQQRNAWIEVHDNIQPRIILGPRSALFLPYKNLGLIIVDEAHDGSYKQDTGTRYNGLVAAGALAKEHSAQLILASATPPVQETQQILAKGGRLVCMHSLAKKNQKNQRKFTVVDMTDKKNMSAIPLLSKTLLGTIEKSLQNKKQTLLFLNKRGTARMLLCENCGWYAECPRCEVPLTHHHDEFILQCNLCGLTRKSKTTCPQCAQALSLKSPGIKAVEEELHKLFPSAKISRFDSDNRKADTFSEQYSVIKSGGADIIIGTQLITKGLDLPLLETVGIIQADSALMLPDYSSEERAFQQLTQVSGRVGRGHSDSAQVIVQSYQADSYLFDFVKNQDWHGFFEQEIKKRKANNYPPYSYAAKIWVTKSSKDKAMQACNELVALFLNKKNLRVLGPAPSFYEKIRGKYSWKLILMSSNRKLLAESVRDLPKDFYYDLDPTSLL